MSSYLEVAAKVLQISRTPLSAREILDRAYIERLVPKHLFGKTQHKTLQARLSEDILRNRTRSLFFRTDPGRFFLRQFLADVSVPDEFKTEFPARRRARDLQNEGILTFTAADMKSLVVSGGNVETGRVFDLLKTNNFRYSDFGDHKASESALVFSFVIVCRKDELLSYRSGRYRASNDSFFDKRSIGFGFPVTQDDTSIFDPGDYGIKLSGLRGVTEDLGIVQKDEPQETNRSIHFERFVLHSEPGSETRLLAIIRYDCPEWFEPTKRRLAINDLRWMRINERINYFEDFDPWSRSVLESRPADQKHMLCEAP